MEQTKLVFTWKDANIVWQGFLYRPDKQEQDRGLEKCVFFREFVLFSFKNVSFSFRYRIFQKWHICWTCEWAEKNECLCSPTLPLGRIKKTQVSGEGMDTLLPSALPRSLGGAGGTPLTFGRPSISAAVLQRDDGRNRLRALPCEKSSW